MRDKTCKHGSPSYTVCPYCDNERTCKGSIQLRTGCGKCSKCKNEAAFMTFMKDKVNYSKELFRIRHSQSDWSLEHRLDYLDRQILVEAANYIEKLEKALLLAKEMIICNDLDIPKTMEVINEALNNSINHK